METELFLRIREKLNRRLLEEGIIDLELFDLVDKYLHKAKKRGNNA